MNRKGQALVEFVLILPIFLLILFAIVDFGNLLYSRNKLQNDSTDIVRMIRNGYEIAEISNIYKDININIDEYSDNYQKIVLTDDIDIMTPFLDRVLGNPFKIEIERIVPNAK